MTPFIMLGIGFLVGWVACGCLVFGAALRDSLRPKWKPERGISPEPRIDPPPFEMYEGFPVITTGYFTPRVVHDGLVEHWDLPTEDAALGQLILPSKFSEDA